MVIENFKARNRLFGPWVAENFNKRHFEAYFVETKEEALAKALELIPETDVVGWGGTQTVNQIGLKKALEERGNKLMDRDKTNSFEERWQLMKDIVSQADTFLTSANAITEAGELLLVDGYGNRVSAVSFGPDNVICIVGMNKVCRDMDSAIARVKEIAGPINSTRWPDSKTPCNVNGRCGECIGEDCGCCYWLKIRVCAPAKRIKVILVNEDLGF